MRLIAALLIAVGFAGGCSNLAAEKAASMAWWEGRSIEVEGARHDAVAYLRARSAVLLENVDAVERTGVGQIRLKREGGDAQEAAGGAAAAVDAEGYWLTASHCVEREPVVLLVVREGQVSTVPVRVVWRGSGSDPGGDIALIFAPVPHGSPVFTIAQRVPETGRVLCRGSGFGSPPLGGGEIASVGGATDGSAGWFEHSAPLGPGDSGGPAMLQCGRLAGVNVAANPRGGRDRTTAVWVAPGRLAEIIAQDRRKRANGG